MEDTEELYYSYLRAQANADYEWILQALGDIQVPNKIIVTGKVQRWNGVSYGGEPCIKGEDYRCTQYADDVLHGYQIEDMKILNYILRMET